MKQALALVTLLFVAIPCRAESWSCTFPARGELEEPLLFKYVVENGVLTETPRKPSSVFPVRAYPIVSNDQASIVAVSVAHGASGNSPTGALTIMLEKKTSELFRAYVSPLAPDLGGPPIRALCIKS